MNKVHSLSFLIKPASGSCNMQCKYCFYEDVSSIRAHKNLGLMNTITAHKLIDTSLSSVNENGYISFAFQGGEPTLIGLKFYEDFVSYANRNKKTDQTISYSIQTNGFNIGKEWAIFFREHKFLVGISIDGNRIQHDRYRIDNRGNGTYDRIIENLKILKDEGVDYNILCVIDKNTKPAATYNHLKKLGKYIQFIPCLDPYEEERGNREYSLTPEYYGNFLCTVFDQWYEDWVNNNGVSIRLFDDYISLFLGSPSTTCALLGNCGGYLVIEADGSLYPCDFYVMDEWKIANINDSNIKEMLMNRLNHPVMKKFMEATQSLPEECNSCKFKNICHGGCRRDRDYLGKIGSNYYCSSFKTFLTHSVSRLFSIAKNEYKYIKN